MPIAFWARAFLLSAASLAAATHTVQIPSGGELSYAANRGKTVFTVTGPKAAVQRVSVSRDATVAAKSEPSTVKVIAHIKPSVIVLTDSYPSIPGGMSMCQAGEERFLRVLSAAKPARETYHLKLESCRDNLELASPGLEWKEDSSTLVIKWLPGPGTKGKPEQRTLQIGPDGAVRQDPK